MLTGLLQPTHLILILVIALVFLGPKRIPEAGRALGQGLQEFKHSIGGGDEDRQLSGQAGTVETRRHPKFGDLASVAQKLN